MTDIDDPVRHWAMIKAQLREAQEKVYKANSITYTGLLELEEMALSRLGPEEMVETEHGTVYIVEKAVYLDKNPKKIDCIRHLKLSRS